MTITKKPKPYEFYRWYANLAIEKRFIGFFKNEKGLASSFSASDLYKELQAFEDMKRKADVEIDRLMEIAAQMMPTHLP